MDSRCGERVLDRDTSGPLGNDRHTVNRFLGLSLGGAKSERTCLAVLDYYRKQEKAFVVDIFEGVGYTKESADAEELNSDQILLQLLEEVSEEHTQLMGVDAPLTLPPCLLGCESECQGYEKCKRPEVRWMRQQYQKAKSKNKKLKHFTPYSQRPVDLYFRYKFPEQNLFQDETLGANLAPQAARMSYLKRHLTNFGVVEVWPKLSLYHLQKPLRLSKREVLEYRHLERGVQVRERVLERLSEKSNLFIYERDRKKIVASIGAFDALLCAWVALQSDLGRVVKFKSEVPLETGWVEVPEL